MLLSLEGQKLTLTSVTKVVCSTRLYVAQWAAVLEVQFLNSLEQDNQAELLPCCLQIFGCLNHSGWQKLENLVSIFFLHAEKIFTLKLSVFHCSTLVHTHTHTLPDFFISLESLKQLSIIDFNLLSRFYYVFCFDFFATFM